ncbi:MAG: MBL fold metallo-hydrolase [Peptococcaceae bacterium]|nr:MBL fold metallo-hydrolase [Peptococcaceae bacterium]
MFLRKIVTLKTYMPGMTMNCYVHYCPDTMKGIVIDPGDNAPEIMAWAEENGVTLERIVLTHGHIDHVGAAEELREAHDLAVSIHKDDLGMLTNAILNLTAFVSRKPFSMAAGVVDVLEHGDVIPVGKLSVEVLHTPGHTPGGICLKTVDGVFSGDTLFKEAVGRTDFPGGDMRKLVTGIQTHLMSLPDSTAVFPGHEDVTTIGHERKFNMMIR